MINRREIFLGAAAVALFPATGWAQSSARSGTFTGESRHVTSGGVEIVKEGNETIIRLGQDFFFDGAPDPKVALGRDGYDANTLLGPLASNTGQQSYVVPASIDTDSYNEVWIWCERFNVPLGKAVIN